MRFLETPKSLFLILPKKEKRDFKSTHLIPIHDTIFGLIIFTIIMMTFIYTIFFYYLTRLFFFNALHGKAEAYILQICYVIIMSHIISKIQSRYYSNKWYVFLLTQNLELLDINEDSMFKIKYCPKLTLYYAQKYIDRYLSN